MTITEEPATTTGVIGSRLLRKEDPVLLTGEAVFTNDMKVPGSRSLPVGGVAVAMACDKVIEKAKQIAAHQMEADVDDLEFVGGEFRGAGTPTKSMPLAAIAFTETGDVDVLKYVAVDDCGNQVNPPIVEGQVHGGVIQGLAQALYEGADYDSDGNLRTSTIADYLVPVASDVPSITIGHSVTPSPTNSLGVKGVGEAGTIGSAPAVMNAIAFASTATSTPTPTPNTSTSSGGTP